MSKVVIEVVDMKGGPGCENKYIVGQKWEMSGSVMPGGLCIGLMSALLPWITCAKYGARVPWSQPNKINICCTDPDHPVIFEIRYEN